MLGFYAARNSAPAIHFFCVSRNFGVGKSGKRIGEWAAGGMVGCALAFVLLVVGEQWVTLMQVKSEAWPDVTRHKVQKHRPSYRPIPQPTLPPQPGPPATPKAVPDQNEIRLPLRPLKKETETLQVKQEVPDPNAVDKDGVTPFMWAASLGDVLVMEWLLDLGADVNQMDCEAHTALYYAMAAKSGTAVGWLIAHGADVNYACCDGEHSPLIHALEIGDLGVIEPILQAARPNFWSRTARDVLFSALRTENKPLIRLLLTCHQTAPTLEDSAQPLLGYAIAWGDYPLLSLLLECGASPNTPLQSPVGKEFSSCVPDRGLREYLETEAGMTPLMLAAAMGRRECAEALLKYGAKRGAVTKRYKMTAIDFAARRSAPPEMLQILLGKSARPEDQRMRINISIAQQRAVFYKDGQVALVSPVSTGRPGFPTPTGQFVVTDKDRMHRSTLYPAYMPYFLRMSCRDFGMHAGVLPGYPDSHGCIRLPWSSAERLFREVDVGTLVTISR